jgi:hypothetical protein
MSLPTWLPTNATIGGTKVEVSADNVGTDPPYKSTKKVAKTIAAPSLFDLIAKT